MKKLIVLFSFLFLFLPCSLYAVGGDGSTCDPSVDGWPMCSLDSVPFAANVTNNATIPGGVYATPFEANQANTWYRLSGGMVAASTAIRVTASNVVIDLNGHEILYNESSPGQGVVTGVFNLSNIAVRNGTITQGAANSEGGVNGNGNNPISSYTAEDGTNRSAHGLYISNLLLEYGGRDVGGIFGNYASGIVSNVTTRDNYSFGTLKNRHAGVDAIRLDYSSVVKNCTILSARQRGIQLGSGGKAFGNKININSISVNSFGVFTYQAANTEIYSNTINATGSHPIGIGVMSRSSNATVYDNYITSRTTMIDDEYSGAYLDNPSATITGNFAVGIRSTWGVDKLYAFNNTIEVYSDSRYVGKYAPTGETAYIDGGARGLMLMTDPGLHFDFYNNIISAIDKDGTGKAYAAAINGGHNSDWLFLRNNVLTSNICNVAIGDEYGGSSGYPMIYANTITKVDNYPAYATFENRYNGYFPSTARIVDNTYIGGANATAYRVNNNQYGELSWYFGTKVGDDYLYDTHIHDGNNTLSVATVHALDPAIGLEYGNPGETPPDPLLICGVNNLGPCDETECAVIGKYWYDGVCNAVPEFLCALDNLSACSESQCAVLGRRWVDGVCTNQAALTDCPDCPDCPPSGVLLLMGGGVLSVQ